MSFQAPIFLLGIVAVPLMLAALALARRRPARYVVRFPALPTLAAVAPRAPRWRRIVPTALLCLALAGLTLALARPEATVAVPIERASVMLVTDTSGSMNATDVEPSRLAAAKASAERFLDRVPDELQVGLVAFSDAPHTVLRPTDDRAEVGAAVDRLAADGGTATGDALDSALRALGTRNDDSPPAAIVLLSDGANQTGRDPADVAREAAAAGVPVYTVALGTADGQVEAGGRVLAVPPDPDALREVATLSGGETFAAEDGNALDQVYERLGSQLATEREDREVTAAFAGGALLLLGASVALGLRRRARLP
jgi:Ca-activated chloride channel homolog